MKFSSHVYKLFVVLPVVLVVAYLIITNNYVVASILLLGSLYCFLLSWEQKFVFLSLTVFFPLAFSNLGPIPEFKWIEMLVPFLCILFIVELLYKRRPVFSKKSFLFFMAIAVLFLWASINYIKRPVSGQMFGAGYTGGGIRDYYTIFVGISTFLCSFWFFRYKKLNVSRWFIVLIFFSLLFGYLRLAGYFKDFYIPFLRGNFIYEEPYTSYHRIGGVGNMAVLGLPITLSLFYKKKWNIFAFLCLTGYLGLAFISGGRACFFGIVLAVVTYLILIKRKYLVHFIIAGLVFVSLYNIVALSVILPHQLDRLFDIRGGFLQQDLHRYYTFRYLWEIFKEYPVFGKGIGYLRNIVVSGPHYEDFISKQLMGGGHSSYLSILCTFGIGGGFFLMSMLFGGIYYAYRIIKEKVCSPEIARLALFGLLYLITLSVLFIVEGTGYSSMELFFLSGMVAGINAKKELENVNQQ